jgi:hypothetical protein
LIDRYDGVIHLDSEKLSELREEIKRGLNPDCEEDVAKNVASYIYQYALLRTLKKTMSLSFSLLLKSADLQEAKTVDNMIVNDDGIDRDFFRAITGQKNDKNYWKVYRNLHTQYQPKNMKFLSDFFKDLGIPFEGQLCYIEMPIRDDFQYVYSSENFVGDNRRRLETSRRGGLRLIPDMFDFNRKRDNFESGDIIWRTFGDRNESFLIFSVYHGEYVYLTEYHYNEHKMVCTWTSGQIMTKGDWKLVYLRSDIPVNGVPFRIELGPFVKSGSEENYWSMGGNPDNLMCDPLYNDVTNDPKDHTFRFTDLNFENCMSNVGH